jgi:hypothetical protein
MIHRDTPTAMTPRLASALIIIVALFLAGGREAAAQPQWFESNSGLEGAFAASLGFDSTGRALAGAACGLYRLDGDRWQRILDRDSVASLLVTERGTILAGSTSGLWRREAGATDWTSVLSGTNASDMASLGSDTILAVIDAKMHRSSDDGRTWSAVDELPQFAAGQVESTPDGVLYAWRLSLYRSDDGGHSWTQVTSRIPSAILLPLAGGRMISTTFDELYASVDGGVTWSVVRQMPLVDLRRDPAGRTLATVGFPQSRGTVATVPAGVYELDDDGAIVATLRTGLAQSAAGGPNGQVVVNASSEMLVSSDRGASWERVVAGLECGIASPLTIDRDGRMFTIFNGLDWTTAQVVPGALFGSIDSGKSWRRLAVNATTVLGAFASGEVLAYGRNDTLGTLVVKTSRDHGATWSEHVAPGSAMVSGNDSGLVAVAFSWDPWLSADTAGHLWISTDTAGTWTERLVGVRVRHLLARNGAILLDEDTSPESQGVHRTLDLGETWTLVLPNSLDVGLQAAPSGEIYAIAHTFVLGVRTYEVWRSVDDGALWQRRGTLPESFAPQLIFAPDGDLYVTGTGTAEHLARSTDGGATWTPIDVPWLPRLFTVMPDGSLVALESAGGRLTMWASHDDAATWRAQSLPPLPKAQSYHLALWGTLYATLARQLVMRIDGTVASTPHESARSATLSLAIAPMPARDLLTVTLVLPKASRVSIDLYDAMGRRALAPSLRMLDAGVSTVPVNVSELAPGYYVLVVRGVDGSGSRGIILR